MKNKTQDQLSGSVKRRRLIIKLSLAVLWIATGILLFIFNRGHTLIVDNNDIDDLRASNLITVTINKKSMDFFRGDRDMFRVGGGKHQLRVEFTDGTPDFETSFSLPLGPDMFLLSIPRITNSADNAIEVFIRQRETRRTEDEDTTIEVEAAP